jgi:hypothetical protein
MESTKTTKSATSAGFVVFISTNSVKGLIIGAIIPFPLNAACTGIVFSSF